MSVFRDCIQGAADVQYATFGDTVTFSRGLVVVGTMTAIIIDDPTVVNIRLRQLGQDIKATSATLPQRVLIKVRNIALNVDQGNIQVGDVMTFGTIKYKVTTYPQIDQVEYNFIATIIPA